jgi:hypothetical protein
MEESVCQWKKNEPVSKSQIRPEAHSKHDETYMFWIRIGKISLNI